MHSAVKDGRRTIVGRSVRWDEEQAKAAYERGYWTHETLADSLQRIAAQEPERVLIVEGSVRLSAGELYERARTLARVMAAGHPEGSVVSFMLPNWHEAAVIYLAATMAGMVANPILPSLREHDLRFMLKDMSCRMIFIPEQFRNHHYAEMLSHVVEQLESPPQVIVLRGNPHKFTAFDSLFENAPEQALPIVEADAVRMIMYTSGTTGNPKGVMHSHNSIHALIKQIGEHWRVEPGDKFLVASPISHIGGSIYAFECPLLLGATAVLMEHWNPDQAVALLQSERCTHFAGATPFLVQTLAAARKQQTRLPSLKLFVCGGASVPASLIREADDYFEHAAVTRVYGSTEVPVMTVGAVGDVAHAAETDGQPGIAQVRLAGIENATGDSGEVIAKGPQMLVGYVHSEDEASVFDENGFFRTGDLGRWVDQNYLVIVGRAKDIIIRHGENIAPKEIEDLLVNLAEIAEIAIVGLPDPKTGERACAVIVPAGDATPTVADLAEFLLSQGVAKFKFPEQVAIWESLPKNDAGKVLKHKIREALLQAEA
ncbi:MAG: AMP-binding protein [Pseudomonadota bacterium]|nr:AMP-binding protein [Pseudomonadota bacterium]